MTTLHLCIDVQKVYPDENPHYRAWWPTLQNNVGRLVRALKAKDVETVYVAYDPGFKAEVAPRSKLSFRNKWQFVTEPLLKVDFELAAHDVVALKSTFSLCAEQEILAYLKQKSVRRVILSGAFEAPKVDIKDVGYCLTQTALDLRKKGCEVIIAEEATNLGVDFSDNPDSAPHRTLRRLRNKVHGIEVLPIDALVQKITPSQAALLRPQRAAASFSSALRK